METKEFKTLRYNEAIVNGYDMIKSALPTIGKAAMGAFKAVFGNSANGGVSSGCQPWNQQQWRGINDMPCKGKDLPGQQILLRPFSKIDVTDDFNNAARYNATRFGLTASPMYPSEG